jgi:hypothetical protein
MQMQLVQGVLLLEARGHINIWCPLVHSSAAPHCTMFASKLEP